MIEVCLKPDYRASEGRNKKGIRGKAPQPTEQAENRLDSMPSHTPS
jgi:hypothetical protein